MILRLSRGYTLIELIAAMAAASVMLVTLASTVAISTSLVEPTDEDGVRLRDRVIANRLSNDLRYATQIDERLSQGFQVTRYDVEGNPMTLRYESHTNGLTRQVAGSGIVQLDTDAPSIRQTVDGYSAPTQQYSAPTEQGNSKYPRVISRSVAATDGSDDSTLRIETPSGSRPGDAFLLVTASQNASSVIPPNPGWNYAASAEDHGLAIRVFFRSADWNSFGTHTITFTPGADVAVAMLAIENPTSPWPFGWIGKDSGVAVVGNASTYPVPLENASTIDSTRLQIQFFVASGAPWSSATMGVASFSDCLRVNASQGSSGECSLGIVTRLGAMPTMSTPPSVLQRKDCNWVTLALEVDG